MGSSCQRQAAADTITSNRVDLATSSPATPTVQNEELKVYHVLNVSSGRCIQLDPYHAEEHLDDIDLSTTEGHTEQHTTCDHSVLDPTSPRFHHHEHRRLIDVDTEEFSTNKEEDPEEQHQAMLVNAPLHGVVSPKGLSLFVVSGVCSADNSVMLMEADAVPLPVWTVDRNVGRNKGLRSGTDAAVSSVLSVESHSSLISIPSWRVHTSEASSRPKYPTTVPARSNSGFGGALDERTDFADGEDDEVLSDNASCSGASTLAAGVSPGIAQRTSPSANFDESLQPWEPYSAHLPDLKIE